MGSWRACALAALALFGNASCTAPGVKIYELAQSLGVSNAVAHGTQFDHVLFFHRMNFLNASDSVHIYVEGDGTPFLRGTEIAADPTPRNPLALRLMSRDNRPAFYVGRPCYFGFAQVAPCHPKYWTTHRYAPEVVDSMAAAIRGYLGEYRKTKRMVFIGYSGGGTLAMLLAARFIQTRAVVTVAGNLDVDAWADHHRYTPMVASLNPARSPVLDRRIFQLHLAGDKDTNVPPELIQPEVQRQTLGDVTVYRNYDHVCCWEQAWPDILQRYGFSYIQGAH